MLTVLARAARLLGAHWPALLAWILGGTLVHFLALKLAAFVGAGSAVGGILLLPIAALALLVAYVAMLLVVREGMPALGAIAPLPDTAREGRAAFLDGVLGGILPFVAFYAAWGFIADDVTAYINDATQWSFWWGIEAATKLEDYDSAGRITDLGLNATTIGIVVIAFAARWAFQRYRTRLPRGATRTVLGIVAVYLEVLWVYLAAYVVTDLLALVTDWVESRQAMVWLGHLRTGLTGWLTPFGVVWDGVEWFLGEAGGIILLPVAWLTIAGVVYGQAVKAEAPRLSGAVVTAARTRYASVPTRIRRRLGDFWQSFTAPFRSIGAALVLMWRAGPVLIASYILLFTVVEFAEQWMLVGAGRAIGPHDVASFWLPMSVGLVAAAAVLTEPVRVAIIAATYDGALASLRPASSPGQVDVEPQVDDGPVAHDAHGDDEGTARVDVQEERRREVDGSARL